jgi:hypothetical protein
LGNSVLEKEAGPKEFSIGYGTAVNFQSQSILQSHPPLFLTVPSLFNLLAISECPAAHFASPRIFFERPDQIQRNLSRY